jgi:hypothetical protein
VAINWPSKMRRTVKPFLRVVVWVLPTALATGVANPLLRRDALPERAALLRSPCARFKANLLEAMGARCGGEGVK